MVKPASKFKQEAANETVWNIEVLQVNANTTSTIPDPSQDWIVQRQLAEILGVSTKTASKWARQGKLRLYEHHVPCCGRRKYSRGLVQRNREQCWAQAVQQLD